MIDHLKTEVKTRKNEPGNGSVYHDFVFLNQEIRKGKIPLHMWRVQGQRHNPRQNFRFHHEKHSNRHTNDPRNMKRPDYLFRKSHLHSHLNQ